MRVSRADDDASLARIDAATWTSAVSPAPPPPPGTSFFDERTDPGSVLVAEVDGATAGYLALGDPASIAAHAHVVEISGLAVDPAHTRRGVGRQLLAVAVDECRRRGVRKLALRVLAPNAAARRLYESAGFVVEGVLRAEFQLGGRFVDDVLMARHLDDRG